MNEDGSAYQILTSDLKLKTLGSDGRMASLLLTNGDVEHYALWGSVACIVHPDETKSIFQAAGSTLKQSIFGDILEIRLPGGTLAAQQPDGTYLALHAS